MSTEVVRKDHVLCLNVRTVSNIAVTQWLFQCMASVDIIEICNQVGEL